MKKRILVTYNMFRDGYAELMDMYDVTFPPDGVETFTYEEVLSMISEYDVLQSMFNFPVDRRLMQAAEGRLKLIANYAAGYDNIDIEAAQQMCIAVANTPDPVTEPTAEQAHALMLGVARRVAEMDRGLRAKSIRVRLLNNLGHSLTGATLGIVGMGRIGQALARRAVASGMRIVYYNRSRLNEDIESKYAAQYLPLDELLKVSDVVSINAPHTTQTHHIIGKRELQLMKSSAILVNTARGPLVDEYALADALKSGEIWGAGLDVFEFGNYPIAELLAFDNVLLTPHTGTQTIEVRHEMAAFVSRNIINYFEGGDVSYVY